MLAHDAQQIHHLKPLQTCQPLPILNGKAIPQGGACSSDIDLLYDIASNIENNTVCALGDACAWPIKGFINKFRDEFEKHVVPKRTYIATTGRGRAID